MVPMNNTTADITRPAVAQGIPAAANAAQAAVAAKNPAADLAQRVRDFITNYAILPGDHYADILTLYVFHTHAFEAARTTPYIYITSKGPGSGKTRVMELLHEITRNADLAAGITGPTLFTKIEAIRPTLFVDEVDTIYSGAKDETLRGVLNSGYKHNGKISRLDAKAEHGFRDFSTFCPKVMAGIDNGAMPATVLDRAIKIVMERRDGQVAQFYLEDVEDDAADLMDELRAWATANRDALRDRANRPAPIEGITDRQNDIARPLLTIASRIGWGDRARRAFIHAFTAQETPLTPEQDALLRVRDHLRTNPTERIASADVANITGHNMKQISLWFGQFGIPSPRVLKIDGKAARGWLTRDFKDAFARFLPTENGDA